MQKLQFQVFQLKKAKEGTYKVGNTVTYEIKVINNGNVTVSGIKVIDELTGDKWTIDNLKPGEEKIFTTKYVIKKQMKIEDM